MERREAGSVTTWAGEVACSLALALLGVCLAFLARRLPLVEDSVPGPGLVPMVLGLLLAALAIGIGGAALMRRSAARVRVVDRETGLVIALLLLLIALFEWIGFLLATFLFLLAGFALIGREPVLRAGAVAAVATLVTWTLFVKALGVQLPAGMLAW